jgi:uncharacterized protein YigE (DUF2233 family)
MKTIAYLLTLICCFNICVKSQQIETISDMHFNGDSYRVCKIPITSQTIQRFQILENRSFLSHKDFISSKVNEQFYFIINASISDSFCNPLGYYVKNGKTIQNVNFNDGNGNFYLKPNGALLFTSTDATICESSKISSHKSIQLGLQSGPLLLEGGLINKQFNPSSKNKNIRCGVGIFTNQKNEKFIVFAVSNQPVTFFNFAQFFQSKLKCIDALCLESGNCVIGLPYALPVDDYDNSIICNYLYFPVSE